MGCDVDKGVFVTYACGYDVKNNVGLLNLNDPGGETYEELVL